MSAPTRSMLLAFLSAAALAACRSRPDARAVAGLEPARPDRAEAPRPDWDEAVLGRDQEPVFGPFTPAPVVEAVAPPRPRLGDESLRQIELRGVPLSEALHLIGSQAGVNLYLDAGLEQTIDVSFPAVTLDDALAVLLERNGLGLVEEPPGVYWVTRADGGEVLTRRFQLRSIDGSELLANLQALAPAATLVVDTNANFLVARAPSRELELLAEYLQAADRVKRQVLIEVEVLEVALDDHFEFGVQGLLSDPDFLGEAGLTVEETLGLSGDAFTATIDLLDFDLSATVDALERYGTVNVISSPRVLAITRTLASIDVIREIPYVETTTEISSGAGAGTVGTTSQETVAFKEAGIKLKVTPIIQEDELVQLAVLQEFSEVVDFFQGIPVLDTRRVDNQFVVRGDQAVLLGGLMQNRTREEDQGVPVLMHIPVLGRLFRSDEDTQERRELLVMITARVLDPEQAAALSRLYEQNFERRLRGSGVPGTKVP